MVVKVLGRSFPGVGLRVFNSSSREVYTRTGVILYQEYIYHR
jgi:hypothetical protein